VVSEKAEDDFSQRMHIKYLHSRQKRSLLAIYSADAAPPRQGWTRSDKSVIAMCLSPRVSVNPFRPWINAVSGHRATPASMRTNPLYTQSADGVSGFPTAFERGKVVSIH